MTIAWQRAGVGVITLACLVATLLPPTLRGAIPPLPTIAYELGVGVLFVVSGLLAQARQRDNLTGPLLIWAGLSWLAARTLIWVGDSSLSFTVGLVLVVLPIAFVAHLALVFPLGRARSPVERILVVFSYVVILGGVSIIDVSGCDACPSNLLQVGAGGGTSRSLESVMIILTLTAIAAFSVVLTVHWQRGGTAARRVLAPVLPPALLYASVSAALLLAELGSPVGLGRRWGWAERVAVSTIPLAFMAGLLRSRLARAGVGQLVVELGESSARGDLCRALAQALGDPSVEVAYWDPPSSRYLDADGRAVTVPNDEGRRVATVLERAGVRIGALVHDVALRNETALLDAVAAAAGLAMENELLHAEVLTRLAEVEASRSRILEAGDAERRRVERNLHDGAQQRLVTLSLALTMARSRLAGPADLQEVAAADALLGEAARELALALRELRELGRGLHPSVLSEDGLEAAVESLAEQSPVPVTITADTKGRLPSPVEAAAYYVVCESLANAAKYAKASGVTVALASDEERLHIEVADDGIGGAEAHAGSGLEGLADRVAAVGGHLVVDSVPGRGTRVTAEIPCG